MESTLIGNVASAQEQVQYDGYAKGILSNRYILAWNMKETVEEFAELPIEQIAIECIGSDEYEDKAPCENIMGDNNENMIPGEGKVIYDVRFHAYTTPATGRKKILFDVEAQKQFRPGYEIVTRGIYYGSWMISTQGNIEFAGTNFDEIKKVYSIWICMNAPDKIGSAISKFMMTKADIKEGLPDIPGSYDKIAVIQIALGRKIPEDKGSVSRLLSVIFSEKMPVNEKEMILAEEYGFKMNNYQREELRTMCNLGEGIFERGMEQGMERGIEQGIYWPKEF